MKNLKIWILVILLVFVIVLGAYFYYAKERINIGMKDNDNMKNYIGKNKEECSKIQYLCAPGYEIFEDEKGCGCQLIKNGNNEEEKTFCLDESRQGDFCIELYLPVCGWFSKEVQCIKYPCAGTFSNSCFACQDDKIEYWTEGECPA